MDASAPVIMRAASAGTAVEDGAPRAAAVGDSPAREDDDRLAAAARAGDAAAREALAREYRGRVYVFALALLQRPEEAEDAAQETFARAWAALPRYRPRGQFRSWLFGITANVCREQRRRARRQPAALDAAGEPADAGPGPGALHAREALRAAVREAVGRLPLAYRGPVVLHYLEEMPVAEVAATLGRSGAAVKVQLWRARAMLRRELEAWME